MKHKNMMKLMLALGIFLIFGTAQASETNDKFTITDKTSMCIGCHGIPGYKTAFPSAYHVPKLGGQHAEYLVKALEGYQTGTRSHPTMTALAKTLSKQDIEELAAYYSKN
ncbi:cytochrome c553 [Nitrosomonas sp. PY1]|uniref:c-type cytochrome n=1 Tax=Nitrosomonas sp. PY1 TaxID=1803906 RepID=UPI001FC87562|nr:cytochrome c [Nitrosomonas sp. PY1]GKS68159.1 cytochrome c553 [Nitrosomonas sp. PY1]